MSQTWVWVITNILCRVDYQLTSAEESEVLRGWTVGNSWGLQTRCEFPRFGWLLDCRHFISCGWAVTTLKSRTARRAEFQEIGISYGFLNPVQLNQWQKLLHFHNVLCPFGKTVPPLACHEPFILCRSYSMYQALRKAQAPSQAFGHGSGMKQVFPQVTIVFGSEWIRMNVLVPDSPWDPLQLYRMAKSWDI